jgi:trk system potassium uptake protein TrkH
MLRVYRPLARVLQFSAKPFPRPRTIGVVGVVFGFAILILIGAFLLSLPQARTPGHDLDILDAFFTATSAVCVTGLVVQDTGTYWTHFGQGVILGLIQLGGLGVMTATMFILIIFRRPVSMRDTFEVHEMSRQGGVRSVSGLLWLTVLITIAFEIVGAAVMWWRFEYRYGLDESVWKSVFHSIAAFNNAGFDIMGDYASVTPFARDPVMLFSFATLVIAGGISVLVLLDLAYKRSWRRLTPNTKIIILFSLALWIVGAGGFLLAEFNNDVTLGAMSNGDKVSNSFFHSIVARTAGFNSVSVNGLYDQTLFLLSGLMFIGGVTGSTAGGVKIGTFAVLVLATFASVRGYEHASIFGRRFGHRLVYRAIAIIIMAMLLVFIATLLLTFTEDFAFRAVLFEVVSAFGTVGLSTGITPDMTSAGKVIIIVVMFIGRLGPLTLAYALARQHRELRYQLPQRDLPIG